MKKRIRYKILVIKIIVLFAVLAVSLVIMAFLLSSMQTDFYLDSFTEEMKAELDDLPARLEQAKAVSDENDNTFDATYQALAESVAFMANSDNDVDFSLDDETMIAYRDLLNVDNVLIVDMDGTILAEAQETMADFSSSRFNRLRMIDPLLPDEVSVEIELPSRNWVMRYYSAQIDDDTMAIIEQDPAMLNEMLENNGSTASVLKNMEVGLNGYIFAMSAQDFLIEYHPNPTLEGMDGLYIGIDVENLEDDKFSWMTINGEEMYCGVKLIDNTYYIACVPKSDMTMARNITVAVTLFAFFAVVFVIIMYGIFAMRDHRLKGVDPEKVRFAGRICFIKLTVRRSAILAFVGFLVIVVISFFMQTLFALSFESLSNRDQANDVVESFEQTSDRLEEMTALYGDRYLPVARALGFMLDTDPSLINQEDLQELADIMQVHDIIIYSATDGSLVATNSAYTNYALSTDPDDPSYEFVKLLQGDVDYVVQEPVYDEIAGHLWQYIGVPIHGENGLIDGIVQISVYPVLLESMESSIDIGSILDDVVFGTNGFAFAVNKADDTFAYFPIDDHAVGESVFDHDITEEQLKADFNDYITIDGIRYYASSAETDDYYIYLAETVDELMSERGPLTAVTAVIAAICILIIFLLVIIEPKKPIRLIDPSEENEDSGSSTIEMQMPGGRKIRTDSIVSRFMGSTTPWGERNAWQKTAVVLRWILIVLVVVICLAVIFKNRLFGDDSIFSYILSGSWERGLNIFAITACIMFICVAMTAVVVVQRVLQLLSSILNARGETICRLISSFLKYGVLIGMIYYSLVLLGINAVTLLASAGILALAISFGAQSLVSDIVSGLFIIFEGDFRVGDIVMIGDWRGTVLEIGIRTTKIEEPAQNVKVIRNSDVTNVINMTKKLSFVNVNYSIEYNESLEHVETILAQELPKIAERLPAIVNGPFYKCVAAWSDSSVDLRINMSCKESDRFQLERDFNREMRLLFERYDISIPFPQIVVNEPTVQKEASAYEKWLAQEFNKEQKEASKVIGEEINETDI